MIGFQKCLGKNAATVWGHLPSAERVLNVPVMTYRAEHRLPVCHVAVVLTGVRYGVHLVFAKCWESGALAVKTIRLYLKNAKGTP